MAKAWRKYNENYRRKGALQRLEAAKFFPKKLKDGKERTEEKWEEKRQEQIKTLTARVR